AIDATRACANAGTVTERRQTVASASRLKPGAISDVALIGFTALRLESPAEYRRKPAPSAPQAHPLRVESSKPRNSFEMRSLLALVLALSCSRPDRGYCLLRCSEEDQGYDELPQDCHDRRRRPGIPNPGAPHARARVRDRRGRASQ